MNINNINIKVLISFVIIIGIILASVVGAVGVYQTIILSEDSEEPDEDYGIYEYIPEDTTMMYQIDAIGFADDQITKDVLNELGEKHLDEENWYDEAYNEFVEYINEEDVDNDELEGNFDIEDLTNVVAFSNINLNYEYENLEDVDYNTHNPEEEINEYNFGLLVEYDMGDNDFDAVINPDDELITTEYNGKEIYVDEEDAFYITQLDSQNIAVTNSEEYIEKIIDTYTGDNDFVNTNLIPEYNNTYMSMSITEMDEFYDEIIEDIDNDMEDIYSDQMFDMYGDEFEDELKESQEEWEEFKDYPTPQTVHFSYSTDNEDTLTTRTEITFDTIQAASRFNQDLDEQDGNVTVDISLSETKVIIEQETTSDVIIYEVNSVIEMFDELFSNDAWEDDAWEDDAWEDDAWEDDAWEDDAWEVEEPDSEVEFEYIEESNIVKMTVLELNEDEYINVDGLFIDIDAKNDDNTTEWADADEEGQVIKIKDISPETTIEASVIESESDPGIVTESFTVPSEQNESDMETNDEPVRFIHNDDNESIDVDVLSSRDNEHIEMHVHYADDYKLNNDDISIDGSIVADEENQTINIKNISEDAVISVIVRESDSTYVTSLEYNVSNEEISEFEHIGYDDVASVLIDESDNTVTATTVRSEGSYFIAEVHSDNDYEITGSENAPDWADAIDVGEDIKIENLSEGDEVVIYSTMGEHEKQYRIASHKITG